jgi:hypothetical protein
MEHRPLAGDGLGTDAACVHRAGGGIVRAIPPDHVASRALNRSNLKTQSILLCGKHQAAANALGGLAPRMPMRIECFGKPVRPLRGERRIRRCNEPGANPNFLLAISLRMPSAVTT